MKRLAFLFIALATVLVANANVVTGQVTDAQGEPLIGVSVVVAGTQNGTITDFDGFYTMDAANDAQLQFSYIGYTTVTEAINNIPSAKDVSINVSVNGLTLGGLLGLPGFASGTKGAPGGPALVSLATEAVTGGSLKTAMLFAILFPALLIVGLIILRTRGKNRCRKSNPSHDDP